MYQQASPLSERVDAVTTRPESARLRPVNSTATANGRVRGVSRALHGSPSQFHPQSTRPCNRCVRRCISRRCAPHCPHAPHCPAHSSSRPSQRSTSRRHRPRARGPPRPDGLGEEVARYPPQPDPECPRHYALRPLHVAQGSRRRDRRPRV
ncbi:hypothetical protein B0H14DRAFT_1659524 [Mycena olivaceomarginata]|nr:hypothetical protein B0H14DRAFT_1659524 [Mycena olivaceomarginata]